MSANLENMLYNNQNGKPWHGEGVAIEGLATSAEAIKHAGLDWTVEKQPLFLPDGTEVPNTYATVRTSDNKIMGTVGDRYHVVQNADAFDWFDNLVGEGEAMFETAGSLNNGTVWMLAKMPEYMQVGKDDRDVIEKYVLLSNSHDGKYSVRLLVTPVRVVCNNTLNFAYKNNKGMRSIRHTSTYADRLNLAATELGIVNTMYAQVNDIFNGMADRKVNTEDMNEYFTSVFGETTQGKNAIMDVNRLVEEGAGSDLNGVRGTLWGAYNAITEYYDHYKLPNGRENTDKLESLWFQNVAKRKEDAFKKALVLI